MNQDMLRRRFRYIIIGLLCTLLITAFISLSVGRYTKISFFDAISIVGKYIFGIEHGDYTQNAFSVITQLRLPRIIASVLVGAALSASGATYQNLFSNPIASPDTLGVSNAASFGAVLGIVLGFSLSFSKIFAFAMGCIAVFIVFFSAAKLNKGNNLTVYLLLIGMIMSSVFSALLSVLKYVADPDNQLPQITYWLMGSMSKLTMDDLKIYTIFFALGIIPLVLLRWRMNLLTLSEAEAQSLGENTTQLRGISILCATLLTASSTAMTGGISWVGLIIPHMVRQVVGNDFKYVLPVSMLGGGVFLLIMDDIARTITINELPISIMTSLVGAPLFFGLLIYNRRRRI